MTIEVHNSSKRYLRAKQLCQKFSICKSNLYDKVAKGILPKPLKFGRTSLWIESEIEDVIERQTDLANKETA